jgi:drug/metabolite transporter (DMT)-like permease
MLTILLRILLIPSINVFQKKLTQKGFNALFIITFTYLFLGALAFALWVFMPQVAIRPSFWPAITVAALLDVLGNFFMVQSLKYTELSIFGPLNAFKPIISLFVGLLLLKEVPSGRGLWGITVILAGSVLLTYNKTEKQTIFFSRGVLYRFLCITCSATAAVYSKEAMRYANAESTLFYWSIIGLPLLVGLLFFRSKNTLREDLGKFKSQLLMGTVLVFCFFLMQYLTLLTFKQYFVGYSLAIFQLSSIVSVFFGYRFFKEKNMVLKIVSSLIMIAGTVLLLS